MEKHGSALVEGAGELAVWVGISQCDPVSVSVYACAHALLMKTV